MKFFISGSKLYAELARKISDILKQRGHIPTTDWASQSGRRSSNLNLLSSHEAKAVIESDIFIALLPGDQNSSAELGLAIASEAFRGNRTLICWASSDNPFDPNTACSYYFHPVVEQMACPEDQLLNYCRYAFEEV